MDIGTGGLETMLLAEVTDSGHQSMTMEICIQKETPTVKEYAFASASDDHHTRTKHTQKR